MDLFALTACEAVALLREGHVTPLALIEAAEKRIEETNGPINAVVVHCFDRARERAKILAHTGHPTDAEPGYLYGLPVLIKDTVGIEGLPFTVGSTRFKDRVSRDSHLVVTEVERKGGIIIGITNSPEFGCGSHTFNDVYGTTTTPFDSRCSAGGSSGGAAAAIAAGQAWLAHGSDLGGSLRIPAAFCGVVGFRASPELASSSVFDPNAPPPGFHHNDLHPIEVCVWAGLQYFLTREFCKN